MAQLHKRVGEDVTVTYGTPADAPIYVPPTRLVIVGTATFPAIGFASTVSDHTSMGTGVLFANQMLPKSLRCAPSTSGSDPAARRAEPRARPDPAGRAARRPRSASLQRIAARVEPGLRRRRRVGLPATPSSSRGCSARPRS